LCVVSALFLADAGRSKIICDSCCGGLWCTLQKSDDQGSFGQGALTGGVNFEGSVHYNVLVIGCGILDF
jgi:hypothetical protein